MRKIKILLVGLGEVYGGRETFILNYYEHLNSSTIHIDFLSTRSNKNSKMVYEKQLRKKSKIYYIDEKLYNPYYYTQLKQIVRNNDYDIIWNNGNGTLYNVSLLRYAKIGNIKMIIVHSHSIGFEVNSFFKKIVKVTIYKFLAKLFLLYGTDFWACSHEAAHFLFAKNTIKNKEYKVINNAIDTNKYVYNEFFRNKVRSEYNLEGKLVIGHIGRFVPVKNHEFIIDIFYEINKVYPNSILMLVGDGKLKNDIEIKIEKLVLKEKTLFTGFRDDIPALLSVMDVFILPSFHEGLPLVLVEAQAASLCCIVSDSVPREVAIVKDLVFFLSLKKTAQEWAKVIIEKKNRMRYDRTKEIVDGGYDIKTEALLLEKLFIKGTER